jgi:alanine racemase
LSTAAVVIDLDALARNYGRLREMAAPAECAAVVKANAYGLGLAPVARRLRAEGCRRFFVANVAEARELRGLLADAPIYVLNGADAGAERSFADAALTPVLNTLAQVRGWAGLGRPAILNLDTGMTRLGLGPADVDAMLADTGLMERLQIEYVMTHLACADEPSHPLNAAQLARFEAQRARLPAAPTSIGNAAGAVTGADTRGDLVRLGIALYGGNPFGGGVSPVEPVASLYGTVVQVRDIDEPCTVGYGATYAIEPPARVAVIAAGYANGYLRALSNAGVASIGGARVPVIGRVSMELICLDVTALPEAAVEVGQRVELFGKDISIDDVAAAAGTISYEILTGLGPGSVFEYVGEV